MTEQPAGWGLARRLGFVFLAVYLSLHIVPDMLGVLPWLGDGFQDAWRSLWAALMPTLGNAALGIEAPIMVAATGSGDMLWNYVQVCWYLVGSLVVAVAVAVALRRPAAYERAHAALRVLVRYGLSLAMFCYGLAKVCDVQFGFPGPMRLAQSYGDSSPMGLAWTFMGYSKAYYWFGGLAEIAAGALLLWRRTTTLGALLACGVLAQIVAINFCFDVPVKLYSSHLLLLAIFLVAHDARRLFAFLVLNRATAPASLGPEPASRPLRVARIAGKAAFGLWMVAIAVQMRGQVTQMGAMVEKGPLFGMWEVLSFSVGGTPRPTSDPERWRSLFVGEFEYAVVQPMRGESFVFGCTHEVAAGTLTLIDRRGEEEVTRVLQAEQAEPGLLVLRGPLAEGAVEVSLRRIETDKMLLVTRGFHWVNDFPFNR